MKNTGFLSSIRFQIVAAISLLVVTAMLLMGFLVTYLARSYLVEEKERLVIVAASLMEKALQKPTEAEVAAGSQGLQRLAERVSDDFYFRGVVHSISFFDLRRQVIWSTLEKNRWPYSKVFNRNISLPTLKQDVLRMDDPGSGDEMLVVIFPWTINGVSTGSVQMVVPVVSEQLAPLISGRLIVGIAAGYALIVILFGALIMAQMVLRPVRNLNVAVRRIMAGERDLALPEEERNEFGKLAHRFNRMAQQLAEHELHMSEQIEELLDVNEELELTRRGLIRSEKLASIGRLAAGVAHEVGNPLSAILGYVDLLQRGGLDRETEQDFLRRIETDVTRIHQIIKGLLDYSRPQKERIERLDLNRVIEETVELLQPQKQFKRIRFDFTSHHRPALTDADAHQIQQVLVNLFLNASHSMEEEGDISVFLERVLFDPSLTYREAADKFWPGESLIVISVMDHGGGMSEEVQARIFDPFYTTKEPGQGTGLGLSVCDKIIDGFGGTLEVSSQPGEGATFTILLPEAVEKDEAAEPETTPEAETASELDAPDGERSVSREDGESSETSVWTDEGEPSDGPQTSGTPRDS